MGEGSELPAKAERQELKNTENWVVTYSSDIRGKLMIKKTYKYTSSLSWLVSNDYLRAGRSCQVGRAFPTLGPKINNLKA